MECRKTIIFLMIAIFIFSIASVSASDVNDTVIAFEDTSQNELSDCNEIVTDNLKASEENNILVQADSDNAVSAESDSEILGESEGNYTDLRNDIANGGSLTKSIYYYHDGDGETIGITTNFMVIDGNGAVIDMSGSNKRAFYVSASHVTIKNLTIKNANYGGDGGAIYFGAYGTVLNCNFADNSARKGGAVYFTDRGTVSNCKFTNNKVFGNPNWGGAICMNSGRVENCYFADNSASQGGAILGVQYLTVTVDTCIFKTGSDTTHNTRNLPPVLNVDNFTTVYGSGEKIAFDLKTNSSVAVSDGNISISVYFKDTNEWVGNYSCLSGEGWIPNLPAGSYYVIYDTEYAEFNAINRTITITLPAGKYYVNVTSLITGNKTVNVTAKTDVPKDMIWGAKLVFILPNGSEINASYGGNGTWWAVHTFDDCSVYQISASYVGVDNVTVNNGTIEVNPPEHTFWFLNYTINGNDNSVIELSNDFYFDPEYDAAFVDGIVINRPVTINGNGNTIDAKGPARIFNVQAENTVIKNLTIQNAKRNDVGGAIYFSSYGTVTNCNFTNNFAHDGGAVYFKGSGTVSNCKFSDNHASTWGGAICMYSGRVENCYFADNSASKGGAILGVQYLTVTVDTCIFKTGSDTAFNTHNLPPVLNVDNFTTVYGSGEKITFDLKTNSGVAVSDGNISISVYFKDTNEWVGNYSCLSGEGWIPDLMVGSYYVIFDTEYAEFQPINRTVTITMPAGNYYINVNSLTTGNKTVNLTAKTNVLKDMIWGAKLVFILPNGSEINASYGGNGTWWAVHTFDGYGVYQISASYVGLDNVTVNNGTIEVPAPEHTFSFLNYIINGNGNSMIELSNDFYFDPDYDAAFVDGIVINRQVTINGNGHTIDAKGQARIFYVQSENTVIENLTLQNAKRKDAGGAIYFGGYGTVTNCNFTNNSAIQGGVVYFCNQGTVSNCKFSDNKAIGYDGWGGAICMNSGRVENCYFVNNSASKGGAILGIQYLTVTVDTCIFKTDLDTTFNTRNLPPVLNVDNFTTVYGSGEKIAFDLKTNSGVPVSDGNISISVYFKDTNEWFGNYSCLSGEGWIPNLPVGSYYVIYDTEYAEFQPINRTITITLPTGKYYVNVNSLATGNKTVNLTAKTDIPKDMIWDAKLHFILPNGSEINAIYGGNGTWWAVHTFDDYGVYQISASYVGVDNVNVNNGSIAVFANEYAFSFLNYIINSNGNSVIELAHDIYFDPEYDSAFVDGIVINRPVTINGNGNTIDAKGQARIFNVQSANTVIKNLTIKNAHHNGDGGAIYFDSSGTVLNCNFTDNTAGRGGAVNIVYYGTVSNCKFTNNKAIDYNSWGGAIYMGAGSVENCYFADNSASKGGAILSERYLGITVDTCIFKTGSDTTYNTRNLPPTLNVGNFTTVYGSGEKITFDLKTNSGVAVSDGNVSISVYFKDTNVWVGNYSCLSGEGWIPDLPTGSYYVIYDTEYAEFQPINRTITMTLPVGKYYVNVTSLTTNNKTVNITAKTDVPKDMIWGAKLVFILPNGSEINASYGGNGTWWAVHTFDDCSVYQLSASYVGVDNVTVNNGTIEVNPPEHTFWFLNYTINSNDNSVIELSNDFYFDPEFDAAFADGIVINRPVTVNGNGNAIDAKGQARIFNVQSENTVIENLTIKNANHNGDGGAIYFNRPGTVLNCNFTDNTASRGGAVYFNGIGTVSNCKFSDNNASTWGGAICMNAGRVENCYFADNSASKGGAILGVQYLTVTVDTCIFKTGSDTTYNTINIPPVLNVDNFTTVYGSGEKIAFDLKTNSGVPVSDGNISISVYFKDTNEWVGNYSCLSGEGWIPDLLVGSYYVIYDTEYVEFQPINRTITITMPAGKYYVNVTSLTTNNKTVNITAKTDIPKDMIWDAKLLFILPNGSEINASYGGNGTWWAVHTFDDYGVYQLSASYAGLDNVTVNNGIIAVTGPEYTFSFLNYMINSNDNSVIELAHDFYFDPEYDSAFVGGIVINRPVTINGNGNAIDAKGQARIFNVQAENTVIENLTIKNANYNGDGGAIHFTSSGTVLNCNFTDNTASNGGAVYFEGRGTVSNCKFGDNNAYTWGGAICMGAGRVENCYFADNSAYRGGAILSVAYLGITVDTCIFKTDSDTTYNTRNLPPVLNVDNFTTVYGSGEKITFDLKTNSGVPVSDGNVSISVYFKDTNEWVGNYSCLSGEGWIPDLPAGSYYVIYDTEYAEFQPINRTITITMPAGKYYVNVTSLTTNNKTVNITAKTDVPKDMIWGAKLVFILTNGSEINASYGGNGTWWAVHTFDDYDVYQISASYVGLDNVTFNNGTITINKEDSTIALENINLDYGNSTNLTVTTTGAKGITAKIDGNDVTVINNYTIQIPVLNAGNHTLTVTTIVDDDHNQATKTVNITVNKVDSTLTVSDITFDYGGSGSIVVSFTGADGVNAKVVGQGDEVVKVNGTNITVSGLNSGFYTLTVTTIADANHNNVTKNATVTVNKVNATLTVDDVALDYGETKNVTVMGEGVVGIVAWIDESEAKVDGFVISIPALDAGTYTLTVTTIADANHNNVTKNVTVTVNKVNATLTVDDVALDYGETKNVTVMGEGVVGIVAWIDESEAKVDGFVISIPALDAGTHTLTVTAIADANHNPVTKEASIRVLKVDSTLAFEKINFYESSIVIAANGASGVTAKIDGVDIVVVDNYTIIIPSLAAGDHILSVTTIPDVSHNPVTSNVTIVVNKLQTELSGNDVIATYNVNTDLVITLKDSAGKALSGVKVTVDLNGAKTYTTDKNGQVKVPTKGLAPKTYTAKINFDGNANYVESAKNIKVTVKKATPRLTAKKKTFKAKTKTKKYTIVLKDNTGKAMKKVKVTLKIKGKKTITVKTNSKGKATFKIKKLTKKGTYKSTVTFKGNKYYNKVSKKVKIKVK